MRSTKRRKKKREVELTHVGIDETEPTVLHEVAVGQEKPRDQKVSPLSFASPSPLPLLKRLTQS